MKLSRLALMAALLMAAASSYASAQIRITEFAYASTPGEYIELTNIGAAPVDLTGWSFDDDSNTPGVTSLSAFGIVAAGESVILTEAPADTFRTAWGLSASVKVIGDNTNNLGRNDQINIYDAASALVDRFDFGDQTFPGTLRTQEVSANIPLAFLGQNDIYNVVKSIVGDSYGSIANVSASVGNPGVYTPVQVPEPSTIALSLMGAGVALVAGRRRLRKRS